MTVTIARISESALDLDAHLLAVEEPWVGAVTSFAGRVRVEDPDAQTPVVALEYSAHPDAEAALRRIAADAIGDRRALVAVSHRVGRLVVGDLAVVIAVASAHRDDAFVVCRTVIEQIKRELPVWKKQWTADGESLWKGIGG
ncbi:molybdenum cofactor biosynthesis protein MoaE [Microbacterium sp. SORGH_AS_0888]|uniref:molybdenum cofactor biosynthesis protein MoaE n=1 Tax=Microbacterium sp. SORGH_AS_0888 TaxID=3041791 RepID=UPI0027861C57|nr:molybdenum cofactor biosynthesis protein MoaE [Microbacterium sp. SORGH_AS_0888]MDQ1130790.1 molybdopterin synthase catalytic subunit [Microbacterium sp. SORGH_AS_0888]